jgi:glycosyltransferase involved in cell wall biosynthesis
MTDSLPVGILLPTRNSMVLLEGHLRTLKRFEAHVREIVSVDSESNDGTMELLQKYSDSACWKLLKHPRGLYQSWNFGIAQITAPYVYVSTVGDSITLEGLAHLVTVAEQQNADVVISKPGFVAEDGKSAPDTFWPIDDIITSLRLDKPALLSRFQAFLFAMSNTGGAILGSSASNLYRTAFMKEHPFPLDFGTVGDGGWGMLNAFEARIAVTPQRFSTFLHHEKSYPLHEYRVNNLPLKLLHTAQATLERHLGSHPADREIIETLRFVEMSKVEEAALINQETLEMARHSALPWILNPSAWKARSDRVKLRNELATLKAAALLKL